MHKYADANENDSHLGKVHKYADANENHSHLGKVHKYANANENHSQQLVRPGVGGYLTGPTSPGSRTPTRTT